MVEAVTSAPPDLRQVQVAALHVVLHAARGADHDVHASAQGSLLGPELSPSVDGQGGQAGALANEVKVRMYLHGTSKRDWPAEEGGCWTAPPGAVRRAGGEQAAVLLCSGGLCDLRRQATLGVQAGRSGVNQICLSSWISHPGVGWSPRLCASTVQQANQDDTQACALTLGARGFHISHLLGKLAGGREHDDTGLAAVAGACVCASCQALHDWQYECKGLATARPATQQCLSGPL